VLHKCCIGSALSFQQHLNDPLKQLSCRRRLWLEIRKERIFLKVPQPKFWCPVCAPAAEKFWRRHL